MALDTYAGLKAVVANYLKRSDLTTPIIDFIFLAEKNIEQKLRFADNDTWTVSSTTTAGQDYVLAPVGCIEPIMFRLETDPIRELEVGSLRELARLRQSNTSGIPNSIVPMGIGPPVAITKWEDGGAGLISKATAVAHGLVVNGKVTISGTKSYNGLWVVTSTPTVDTFTIPADGVADDATGLCRRYQMSLLFDEGTTAAEDYTLFYRAKFEYLKDTGTDATSSLETTWLLDQFPNLLLYGTLMEAEPYIKNDPRVALWAARFEDSLRAVRKQQWRKRAGGGELRVRPDVPLV